MPIKAILTSEEHAKLPEQNRQDYVLHEKLNKFVLNVEPVEGWALEDVRGLKAVMSDRTERHKQASDRLAAYGDITPESAKEAFEKLSALGEFGDKKKLDERLSSMTSQVEKKYQTEVTKKQEEINLLTATVSKVLIDGEAARILADPKVKGSYPLLIGVIRQWTKVERDEKGGFALKVVDPENGTPLLSQQQGNNGPMGLEEFITSLRNKPDYQMAFAGSSATGSGATAGTAKTGTRSTDRSNLSPQDRLKFLRAEGK